MSNSAHSNRRLLTAKAWTCAVSHLSRKIPAKAANVTPMSFSLQVSVRVAPMDVSYPVFLEEAYHPAPLSEKTATETFVVEISAWYKLPVNYSIASGDEKGEPWMWNNGKRGCETTSTALSFGMASSLLPFALTSVPQPLILDGNRPSAPV